MNTDFTLLSKKISCWFLLLFSIISANSAYSQDSVFNVLMLGDTTVCAQTIFYNIDSAAIGFINLHDDENTSIEAADRFLCENGGKLFQLKHSGRRNIVFNVDSAVFVFDPNRIFTPAGIKATLKKPGKYYNDALKLVEEFAEELKLNFVIDKSLLIALHNNTEGKYSIKSYLDPKLEKPNARKVYINKLMDLDDFVYTTDENIFNFLKKKKINAVLQNNKTMIDDGSLSVYAAKINLPYINIEAQTGHIEEQWAMLNTLKQIIAEYKK